MPSRKYYYTFDKTGDAYSIYLSDRVIIGLLKVLIFILAMVILIFYNRQLYNLVVYKYKKFTKEDEIIKFVGQLGIDFKNAYSINYIQNDNLLEQEQAQTELETVKYQHIISKDVLTHKVLCLFNRYQQDLMAMKFDSIAKYTLEPFKSRHQYIKNINVRYNYKISEIIPLNFDRREGLNRFIVQINGEIVRFKVSRKGYVLSGLSQLRSFTEYWDIALGGDNKGYIVTICEVKD